MLDRRTVVIGLTAATATRPDSAPASHRETQQRDPPIDRFGSPAHSGTITEAYSTRSAMAARTAPALLDYVTLTEDGREGTFVVQDASNWTPVIAADSAQGVTVRSTADATKVYVRADIWKHFWDIRWFGAVANDQFNSGTDCLSAINAMLAGAAAVGKLRTNDTTFNGLIGCDFQGYYYCSALINLKTPVHLRGLGTGVGGVVGGSRIRFPAGVAAIVVNGSDTTGYTVSQVAPTTSAGGSIIENLPLCCGDGSRPAAGVTHGILLRTAASVINPYVSGFAGSGIAILAGTNGYPFFGNANGCHVRGGRSQNNGLHGLHLKGADANACEIIGLDTFNNGRWGKLDESFLGVAIVGGQDAANGEDNLVCFPADGASYACVYGQEKAASTTQPGSDATVWTPTGYSGGHSTWTRGMNVVAGGPFCLQSTSTIIQPYTEAGQGPSQVGTSSLCIGGLHGARIIGTYVSNSFGKLKAQGGFAASDQSFFSNSLRLDGNISFPGVATAQGFLYQSNALGLVLYGGGTAADVTIANRSGSSALAVKPNSVDVCFGGNVLLPKGGAIRVDGTQVVGPRQGGIERPRGGTTIDSEARQTVEAILRVLSAHGLTD